MLATRGRLLEKRTQPPSRYTQASLIKKLEAEGIGRPATYAAIMDTLVSRAYVKTDKRNLVPTETGYLVVDSLATRFQFIELGYTRDIERDLDRIAQGEAGYKTIIQGVHENLQREIGALHISCVPKNPCPQCGKPLHRKKGKKGYFWGCTGYPDCTATLPDENGEPGQAKTLTEVSEYLCKQCGKPLMHKFKAGKGGYDFWGCADYKNGCTETYPDKHGKPHYTN